MDFRRASLLGLLVALALALHLLESQLPSPLPWVRPGLANLMTLLALLTLGWRAGMLVTLLRVVIGGLLTGGFLGPGFALSLAGGVASTAAMALMTGGVGRLWSPIAASATGAVAHGGAQVLVLSGLLLRSADLGWLLRLVLVPSLLAGVMTGVLANLVLLRWQRRFPAAA